MRPIDADKFWEQFEKGKANLARVKTMLPSEVVDITIAIYDEIKERLENAPTIEPERPSGHWLGNYAPYTCSGCGKTSDSKRPYCAWCGRKADNYDL